MITVSWPGLRLWTASVPASPREMTGAQVTVTAAAYDAAGHVVGRVQLGHME